VTDDVAHCRICRRPFLRPHEPFPARAAQACERECLRLRKLGECMVHLPPPGYGRPALLSFWWRVVRIGSPMVRCAVVGHDVERVGKMASGVIRYRCRRCGEEHCDETRRADDLLDSAKAIEARAAAQPADAWRPQPYEQPKDALPHECGEERRVEPEEP